MAGLIMALAAAGNHLKINYQTWVRVDLEDVPVVLLWKIQWLVLLRPLESAGLTELRCALLV